MSLLRRLTPPHLQNSLRSSPLIVQQRLTANPLLTSTRSLHVLPNMAQERPTGLKANKGIELLTWATPNGVKASIILEELKEAYGKVGMELQWPKDRN